MSWYMKGDPINGGDMRVGRGAAVSSIVTVKFV